MRDLFLLGLGAVGTILVGFAGSVLFRLWSDKRAAKVVETYGFYFDSFPKGLHHKLYQVDFIPDDVWDSWPAEHQHLVDNMRLYVFFMRSACKVKINDLKVKAHAKEGSGIAGFTFNVDRLIICDRLATEQDTDKSMTATWAYLNPGDFIELYVLATGTNELADISIDVDGEDVAIQETFPGKPIKLVDPFRYPFISPKHDEFLVRYVKIWTEAASHGDSDFPKSAG